MSTTLIDAEARNAMHARIDRLSPESVPCWKHLDYHLRQFGV